jgi:hypothetical protein
MSMSTTDVLLVALLAAAGVGVLLEPWIRDWLRRQRRGR